MFPKEETGRIKQNKTNLKKPHYFIFVPSDWEAAEYIVLQIARAF